MALQDLKVTIAEQPTGMADAVLAELAKHLADLAVDGTEHAIDLRSLPMNDADRDQLREQLGNGEVDVTLTTIGSSHIYETAYSGIWWISHRGADDEMVSELLEITNIPKILLSPHEEIAMSADKLANLIQSHEEKSPDDR